MGRFKSHRKGDRQAPIPIYYQLQQDLLDGIENGRWAPGEAIPPERKIAGDFGVSLGTVNRALANLVSDGYLNRIQGKGTFVSGTTIPAESVRYTRLRRNFADSDPKFKVQLLDLQLVSGSQPACRNLNIRVSQKLWQMVRLFSTRDSMLVYNTSYLPHQIFPDLNEIPPAHFEKVTLYETVERKYGLPTMFSEELFGVELADDDIAKALKVELGKPLLRIEMRTFTYKDQPYEYRISHCLADDRMMFREM